MVAASSTPRRPRAVITGASSGIGAATAKRFSTAGWDVLATALDQEGLQGARARFAPGTHGVVAGDYRDPRTLADLTRFVAEHWGGVEALINCAGANRSTDLQTLSLAEWRAPLDVLLDGALATTQAMLPWLTEGGRIVHITSIHAQRAEAGSLAYAMAKAAIEQMCRGLAVELATRKILVNAIAPGFVNTPMSVRNGKNELHSQWFEDNYVRGHHLPLRRPGEPDEIAGVALFLAGPDASYMTGQVLTVDGGLTITF